MLDASSIETGNQYKDQRTKQQQGTGAQSHKMQALQEILWQWICTRTTKQHTHCQMQLQQKIQRMETGIGVPEDWEKVHMV